VLLAFGSREWLRLVCGCGITAVPGCGSRPAWVPARQAAVLEADSPFRRLTDKRIPTLGRIVVLLLRAGGAAPPRQTLVRLLHSVHEIARRHPKEYNMAKLLLSRL
jgi:hypothetical protein